MTQYQVNLPKTAFPMKADLAKREPKLLQFWLDLSLYEKIKAQNSDQEKTFILHDGPPYANGAIHLGHALNKILKDIVNKSKHLDGYAISYVPGWDCHGLPIEINVEKKIGRVGKVSLAEFIGACHRYATEQIALQSESFIRLGVLGDFEHPYKTMDSKYEANVVRALAEIFNNGYVERGYKPVYWCVHCGSALAEAEVEYKNKTSLALDVRFRFQDGDMKNVSIPIWTTTPWTLPANEAVALHPDLEYVLVDCIDLGEKFIVAKALLAEVMKRYGSKDYREIKNFLGKDLQGFKLKHPFLKDKLVPIVLGEHVVFDTGTGAVHTAPAHGQDDYNIGIRYGLPMHNPVDDQGRFLPDTPFFAGEQVFTANDYVVEVLREQGNLIHVENIEHSYPHCWRHKTPLIFRATKQWFISMDKPGKSGKNLRDRALAAVDEVTWIPESGKERMRDMIKNRPDWCISRQRSWGTPIPFFIHKETQELHPKTKFLMERVADAIEKEGITFWHKVDAEIFLKEHAKEHKPDAYKKIDDTLDVWFDSGVSHFCVLNAEFAADEPKRIADLYLEGGDQYRGWFQSSLLTALAMYDKAPYKQVLTHGMTVDASGHKMSKSLGNVISPHKIIDTLGADVLRLWVASSYIFDDLSISQEILQRTTDAYRVLRNMARFLLGNLFDFNPEKDLLESSKMMELDRWILQKVLNLRENSKVWYDNYQFHNVSLSLRTLIANDLSSFYFSVIKDRLYTMPAKSIGRRSAQTALFHILKIIVRLIAPILSFTAEEIWQEMKSFAPCEESVFLSKEHVFDFVKSTISDDDWNAVVIVRNTVNNELEKLRASGQIGSSLEAEVVLYCGPKFYSILNKINDELRFILITSGVEVKELSAEGKNKVATEIKELFLEVHPLMHKKCSRCWHYRADVGDNSLHPELCGRCVGNLTEEKVEERFYA